MKAPDRIYINSYDPSLERGFVTGCIEKMKSDDIEYFCKDIVDETIKIAEDHAYFAGQEKFREKLIEWAKEKLEDLKGLLDTDPYKEVYVGQCEVYKELIDKLNSI